MNEHLNVRDIIKIQETFDICSFYEIEAICLGGIGQENLIKIKSLSRKPGVDIEGIEVDSMYIPMSFVHYFSVYKGD